MALLENFSALMSIFTSRAQSLFTNRQHHWWNNHKFPARLYCCYRMRMRKNLIRFCHRTKSRLVIMNYKVFCDGKQTAPTTHQQKKYKATTCTHLEQLLKQQFINGCRWLRCRTVQYTVQFCAKWIYGSLCARATACDWIKIYFRFSGMGELCICPGYSERERPFHWSHE